jgi:hypothetical protein
LPSPQAVDFARPFLDAKPGRAAAVLTAIARVADGPWQDQWDVREHPKSRGATVSETITSLLRDLDVAGYLAAAGVPGADISALRGRLR